MKCKIFQITLELFVVGFLVYGGSVLADPASYTPVVLDDWGMLNFTFCPNGDVQNTISFSLWDVDGNPVYSANARIFFFNQTQIPSVVFCNDPNGDRSENFYAVNDFSNHYTATFNLAAGADINYDVDWFRMSVEWGPNYGLTGVFPQLQEASPDLTGDLVISLSDVGAFSSIINGVYDVRADFNHDGLINLSDTGFLSSHISHSCP